MYDTRVKLKSRKIGWFFIIITIRLKNRNIEYITSGSVSVRAGTAQNNLYVSLRKKNSLYIKYAFPLFAKVIDSLLCSHTSMHRKQISTIECRMPVRQCQFRKSNRAKCRSYTSFIEKLIRRPTSFSRVYFPLSVSSTFSASSHTSRRAGTDDACMHFPHCRNYMRTHMPRENTYVQDFSSEGMKKRFDRATNHSPSFSFSRPLCLPLLGFRILRALPRATSLRLFPVHPELSIRDFYFAMPSGCRSVL